MTNVSQRMLNLGTARSEIREAFAFAQARAAEVGAENVDDFSIGNPSVPAPATVAEAVHKLVDAIDPIKLHGYTPAQGDGQARGALADDLNRRFGTNYTADNFYLTAGAAGALCCALSALSCPGDTFIAFAPYFPEYKVFVESAGAELVTVPADIEDFQIDFAAFDQALTPNTKGVIINIKSSPDIALDEIDVASQLITERASEDANIIWGAAFDETMEDEMMVTVIATGFDGMNGEKTQKPAAPAISDADLFGNPSAPSTGSTTSAKSDDDTFSDIMSIFNRK